jgi:hypothetical protein
MIFIKKIVSKGYYKKKISFAISKGCCEFFFEVLLTDFANKSLAKDFFNFF